MTEYSMHPQGFNAVEGRCPDCEYTPGGIFAHPCAAHGCADCGHIAHESGECGYPSPHTGWCDCMTDWHPSDAYDWNEPGYDATGDPYYE